jgi:cell division protein FtsB
MSEQMTYEQQAQRIAKLERKLAHMTEREAQQAARVAELEAQIKLLKTDDDFDNNWTIRM